MERNCEQEILTKLLMTRSKGEMALILSRLEWRRQLVDWVDIVRDSDQITTDATAKIDIL